MSYLSISKCVADTDFQSRVIACVADEGANPTSIASNLFWQVAVADDIEAAYKYALDADIPNPGADETVITDGMILSVVQSLFAPPEPPPEQTPEQQPG